MTTTGTLEQPLDLCARHHLAPDGLFTIVQLRRRDPVVEVRGEGAEYWARTLASHLCTLRLRDMDECWEALAAIDNGEIVTRPSAGGRTTASGPAVARVAALTT